MNKTTHIFQKIATLLVCMALLSSCIKENMSNCPEEIRIYFDISTRAGNNGINPADIDMMHLYVFNDKGLFFGEYIDDSIDEFGPDYYINCSDLFPARYRFIAWGGKDKNCYSTYPEPFVKGKTSFDEALLTLNHLGGTVSRVHHLFHSDLSATVTNEKVQRFIMPLTQHTNTINISTVGLPANNNEYTFEITDNNCSYLFDRSFTTCQQDAAFKYAASCEKDEKNQLYSTLNVMRLAANRHTPQLQIINKSSGTALYPKETQSGDLIELILKANPQNDFKTTHVYDIVLEFKSSGDGDPTNISVTIFINGWKVIEQNGDLSE